MAVAVNSGIPIDRYLALEATDQLRYEYHAGAVYAMSGGTIQHAKLCSNVLGMLREALRTKGKNCFAFTSEVKIEIERANRYVYPDAAVVCGEIKESNAVAGAIRNPRVVVEVLSDSSGAYDRGAKMRYYLSLPTVKEYVLIEPDRPHVTVYRRHGDGKLGSFHYADGLDDSIALTSIGAVLPLAELYRNVTPEES